MTHREIAAAIEQTAPLHLQEQWDNSGFQTGYPDSECTGVLLCVDATEDIVKEAAERHCSLIVAHHPLIFRGVRQLLFRNRVERTIAEAISRKITIYSSHTSADNAPHGVSWLMADKLGLTDCHVLSPLPGSDSNTGCGATGYLPRPLDAGALVQLVKNTFGSPVARCSDPSVIKTPVTRIALCGGAGSDFITQAIETGAQAYITSDTKHNFFLDHADDIFIIDIGHYESENCTKEIFYRAISEKFPKFAVYYSDIEQNPIHYL